MPSVIDFYNSNAKKLSASYESLTFEEVHDEVIRYLPPPCPALDIGSGSGRDAAWLKVNGFDVTAIEPSSELLQLAQKLHPEKISWVDDYLPLLKSQNNKSGYYGLILISGVWMHIAPSKREKSIKRISELTANYGILIVTLRHGPLDNRRKMFAVPKDEIIKYANKYFYKVISILPTTDRLKRDKVSWEAVVFQKIQNLEI